MDTAEQVILDATKELKHSIEAALPDVTVVVGIPKAEQLRSLRLVSIRPDPAKAENRKFNGNTRNRALSWHVIAAAATATGATGAAARIMSAIDGAQICGAQARCEALNSPIYDPQALGVAYSVPLTVIIHI